MDMINIFNIDSEGIASFLYIVLEYKSEGGSLIIIDVYIIKCIINYTIISRYDGYIIR